MTAQDIIENLRRVKENIAAAARRAGRSPEEIKLVTVTKTVDIERIKTVFEAGCRDFGENRVQELVKKQPLLPQAAWHFIGHLQRNKIRNVAGRVALIHSLDRWSLAEDLDRWAHLHNRVLHVLVQVNVAGEETKFGVAPGEVEDFVAALGDLKGLAVDGLMTIAPYVDNPEEVRPVFRELRSISVKLSRYPFFTQKYLSMGMTNDYTVAIEEGANILRIGSAIFGSRSY